MIKIKVCHKDIIKILQECYQKIAWILMKYEMKRNQNITDVSRCCETLLRQC